MTVPSLKQPGAFLPLVMAVAALALLLGYLAMFGVVEEPAHDERAPARIFQLLLVSQGFLMTFFAIKWLPRAPLQTLQILAIQTGAALVPIVILFFLEQ